jgi:bifunctional DNA-binding transcriptional regulator/antitoxin component of YhaV-PrlF toxin-antitoxin module
VTIPDKIRQQLGVKVGDLLEARVVRGKITLTPKTVVDRGIARSLAEFKAGSSYGPFKTHEELVTSLHKEAKKLRAKNTKHTAG